MIASTARPPAYLPPHCAGPGALRAAGCDPCSAERPFGAVPGLLGPSEPCTPARACPAPQGSPELSGRPPAPGTAAPRYPVWSPAGREQWDARGFQIVFGKQRCSRSSYSGWEGAWSREASPQATDPESRCEVQLLGDAVSITSHGLWGSAAGPRRGTLLQSTRVVFQSPSSLSCSRQTTPRSAAWLVPVEPIPVRDSGILLRDTSPAPSQAMGSAGGAAVSQSWCWRHRTMNSTTLAFSETEKRCWTPRVRWGCPFTCCIGVLRLALREIKWVFVCLNTCLKIKI